MAGGREEIAARIDEVYRLAWHSALKMWRPPGYDLEDMVEEGMLAVWINADRYNPQRGSLSTFVEMVVYTWIKARVQGRMNTKGRKAPGPVVSMEKVLVRDANGGQDWTVGDMIADEAERREMDGLESELSIEWMMDMLPNERDRTVARRCLIDGEDNATVAKELGLSKERVRQIGSCVKRAWKKEIVRNWL